MKPENFYSKFLKCKGISIDSREIKPGNLFFALKGENTNGNIYASKAIDNGAEYAIIDDPDYLINDKTILVDDSIRFLQELARLHIDHLKKKIEIFALTGSNGKTTTKELIFRVLSVKYRVWATPGNLNNHLGVPITILNTPKEANFLIIEMGANSPGEIDFLCQIGQPQYGMITNIGKAHLEGFGGLKGVIKTKLELFDFLENNQGVGFVNMSNQHITDHITNFGFKKIFYGDNTAIDAEAEQTKKGIRLIFQDNKTLDTQLPGTYNKENVLAACAVASFFNVNEKEAFKAISGYIPGNMRSQIIHTDNNIIHLDAYNANPTSMEQSISDFASYNAENKMVIIGEMMELGEYSNQEHQAIVNLTDKNFSHAILLGKGFKNVNIPDHFQWFDKKEDLINYLKSNTPTGKNILIKGSRSNRLEEIVSLL